MPEDSRVEIDAKITAGELPHTPIKYCKYGKVETFERIFYYWTSNDGRGACCCQGQKLGGVSCPHLSEESSESDPNPVLIIDHAP
jgi:hypothetical protein